MYSEIISKPIFFERNRVGRIYTGGLLFSELLGDAPQDNFFPEEWICSLTAALNEGSDIENEGISVVRGTDILFSELAKKCPYELFGESGEFPVLVKFLDSAIRLPIQAHPDRAYSEKYLNSTFGKAESWIVLATRENACLYFGFKDKLTKEQFADAVEKSYSDPDYMEPLLNRIPVKPGDIYFVPAKMVHAIGAGCLILETQEPTDFTIQPEAWCAGKRISENTMYLGLEPDIALDVFDFDTYGIDAVNAAKKLPKIFYDEGGVLKESLISRENTPCFGVNRITVTSSYAGELEAPAIYIVTEGEGYVCCGEEKTAVKKGDYFFAPFTVNRKFSVSTDNKITLTQHFHSL